jgi:hypothetical protein
MERDDRRRGDDGHSSDLNDVVVERLHHIMALRNQQLNRPTQMRPDVRPEHGDIVIIPLGRSVSMHALSVMPGPAQILSPNYDEALGRARNFAARERVDVWVAEDEHDIALVARHRKMFSVER